MPWAPPWHEGRLPHTVFVQLIDGQPARVESVQHSAALPTAAYKHRTHSLPSRLVVPSPHCSRTSAAATPPLLALPVLLTTMPAVTAGRSAVTAALVAVQLLVPLLVLLSAPADAGGFIKARGTRFVDSSTGVDFVFSGWNT
jgi:hypothetical protein